MAVISDVEYARKECADTAANMELEITKLENLLLTSPNDSKIDKVLREDEFKDLEEAIRRLQNACSFL